MLLVGYIDTKASSGASRQGIHGEFRQALRGDDLCRLEARQLEPDVIDDDIFFVASVEEI
jgi:hypothetical protein